MTGEWPTVEELRPFLGDRWAVCRPTAGNLARYGRCITRAEFKCAQALALAARTATMAKPYRSLTLKDI